MNARAIWECSSTAAVEAKAARQIRRLGAAYLKSFFIFASAYVQEKLPQ
jgi:hypothetical protein